MAKSSRTSAESRMSRDADLLTILALAAAMARKVNLHLSRVEARKPMEFPVPDPQEADPTAVV